MPFPSLDEMRAEFHRLGEEEVAIKALLAPYEAKYQELRAQECAFHDKHVQPVIDEMEGIKNDLFTVQNQKAQIVRFLRGTDGVANTGDPAAA